MFTIQKLSKVAIFSVFLVSSVSAMSDDQKLQNAVRTITSQDMKHLSEQEYTHAWSDLELLVKKGFGKCEAKKIISATVDRYKNQWEEVGRWPFFAPFDVQYSRSAVIDLVTCCVKNGFYRDGAIEFIKVVQDIVMADECVGIVTSLLDAGYGFQELEQIAREGLRACTIGRIGLGLLIYRGLVKKELFLQEALLAVKQTISHCDDEIFKTYSNACIIEPAFKVLVALVDEGYFLDDAFAIAARFLNDIDKEPNDVVADLLMSIAYHDSYTPKILQLMQQSLASNDVQSCESLLSAISSLVMAKGRWFDDACQAVNQAFAQNNSDVRCALIKVFQSFVYHDIYVNEAIAVMHAAEPDEDVYMRDAANDLRCWLAIRGNVVEETVALARSQKTAVDDTLKFYQALVQSGHYLDEAFEKAKLLAEQDDGQMCGVLALFGSLFLQGHRVPEVKQCAIAYTKKLGDNFYYVEELGGFATIKLFASKKLSAFILKNREKGEESEMLSDDACQIFFNALFTSPDLAHAKESCDKVLRQADIDPTMFIDTFF